MNVLRSARPYDHPQGSSLPFCFSCSCCLLKPAFFFFLISLGERPSTSRRRERRPPSIQGLKVEGETRRGSSITTVASRLFSHLIIHISRNHTCASDYTHVRGEKEMPFIFQRCGTFKNLRATKIINTLATFKKLT